MPGESLFDRIENLATLHDQRYSKLWDALFAHGQQSERLEQRMQNLEAKLDLLINSLGLKTS